MITWLLTFFILIAVVIAMAIGFILTKKPITGSCGGLNKLGLKEDCPICGGKSGKTIAQKNEILTTDFYDAITSESHRQIK